MVPLVILHDIAIQGQLFDWGKSFECLEFRVGTHSEGFINWATERQRAKIRAGEDETMERLTPDPGGIVVVLVMVELDVQS